MHSDIEAIVLRFNDSINRRDLEGLVALMTPDHRFVDSAGREVRGVDAVRRAWSGFFDAFPDYRNSFSSLSTRDAEVVIVGHSVCSVPALQGSALWTAQIRDGLVAEWRVHEDTPDVRRALGVDERA